MPAAVPRTGLDDAAFFIVFTHCALLGRHRRRAVALGLDLIEVVDDDADEEVEREEAPTNIHMIEGAAAEVVARALPSSVASIDANMKPSQPSPVLIT